MSALERREARQRKIEADFQQQVREVTTAQIRLVCCPQIPQRLVLMATASDAVIATRHMWQRLGSKPCDVRIFDMRGLQ